MRYLYGERAARLACFASASMFFALLAAVSAPFVLLTAGPLLYGVPHLVSSLRYVPRTVLADSHKEQRAKSLRRSYFGLGFLMLVVGAWRCLQLNEQLFTAGSLPQRLGDLWLRDNRPELLIGIAALLILVLAMGKKRSLPDSPTFISRGRPALGLSAVVLSLLACYFFPATSVGLLVLAHNFVAFVYWRLACKTAAERRAADGCLVLFCLANVAIFSGVFTGWPTMACHATSAYDDLNLGTLILPWLPKGSQAIYWHRAVVAYAFGQAVHYFIWLRVLPEQHLPRQVPVTWRQSLGLMQKDFGGRGTRLILFGCLVAAVAWIGSWAFGYLETALLVYVAVAAGHGYVEIAGLFARAMEAEHS